MAATEVTFRSLHKFTPDSWDTPTTTPPTCLILCLCKSVVITEDIDLVLFELYHLTEKNEDILCCLQPQFVKQEATTG